MTGRKLGIAKGYLIDPEAKTIIHINYDLSTGIDGIYKLIGADPFTIVQIEKRDAIFVDDEGLLKNPRYFFQYRGYHQPLAGKGLVLGTNEEGDTVSAKIKYEDLKSRVSFLELSVQDMVTTSGPGWIKTEPVFGPPEVEGEEPLDDGDPAGKYQETQNEIHFDKNYRG